MKRKALVFCDAYRELPDPEKKAPILEQLAQIWSSQQNVTLQFAKKFITAQVKPTQMCPFVSLVWFKS